MNARLVHSSLQRETNGPTATAWIVVLSWNGGDLLTACLASLRAQTVAARLVVVDNASSDGSARRVHEQFPDAVLLENARNLGVAEGYNVGLRYAMRGGAKYVLLLNQDTTLDASMLAACIDAAKADSTIGAVAPRMLLSTHRSMVNSTGIEMNAAGWAWDRGVGSVDGPRWQHPGEVLAASGGAMLLRTDALRHVGLFDPDYFAYYEDVDLCLRLRGAGYRIVFAPDAVVFHRFSSAFGEQPTWKAVLFRSNRWRLLLKHFPLPHLLRIAPALARTEARLILGWLSDDRWRGAGAVLSTTARIAAGLPGVMRYRLRHRISPAQRGSWWRFVTPKVAIPDILPLRPDYRLVDTDADVHSDRIVMGVNDTLLGEGWPARTPVRNGSSPAGAPAARAVGRAATCFLRVAAPGAYVLQLHVGQPPGAEMPLRLQIVCNHALAGSALIGNEPAATWQTLHLPVTLHHPVAAVQLVVDDGARGEGSSGQADTTLLVSEIALLRADSPLLRTPLAPLPAAERAAHA